MQGETALMEDKTLVEECTKYELESSYSYLQDNIEEYINHYLSGQPTLNSVFQAEIKPKRRTV